jgi:hypothetical protein
MEKDFFYVRSPALLFTNLEGFFQTLIHLEKRKKSSIWDWHVVHYIPTSDDGFPSPLVGLSFDVYIIFCYGYDATKTSLQSFKI